MSLSRQRRRPPRLEQVFQAYDPPLYFSTKVTWKRLKFLACHIAHDAFAARARLQADMGIAIGRYILMPDHFHVFISIPSEHGLSEAMKQLEQSVTKALRVERRGLVVWEPGFFDRLLRSDESYEQAWEYVRLNPVRAGLVECPDDWPYQGEIVRIDRA